MEVSINDLRKAAKTILDRMDEISLNGKVDIPDNYYWHIPDDRLFVTDKNSAIDGADLTTGRTWDDIEILLECAGDEDVVTSFHAKRLGQVLYFSALSINDSVW